ncbi:C40 family peptidase (plasmid) [Pseudonocardia sp. DSM 110487]|uniref:C40 family peptidase n=1 Tax=Pseudonocardia sp. DSM 110487 TaxID=2865833 RepID=UPI001C6A154B|nr:C40 family peptidase [Pseudonocardia sp. DSM 110487]QYN41077.1 C40 family peptidase [Pseudonocardia sp. DSM 110487]
MPGPLLLASAAVARPRTTRRVVGGLIALTVASGLLLSAVLAALVGTDPAFTGTGGNGACISGLAGASPAVQRSTPGGGGQAWTAEQQANAQVIVAVGREQGTPPRAQWIALATAMQESSLINLDRGHLDSLGLFQQRPSAGWGTPQEILDPRYASTQFYARLAGIPGWEQMPLTQAAQAVQRSAFPDAYAKWEGAAAALLAQLGGATDTLVCQPGQVPAGAAGAALAFAGEQLGKPYQWGATGPDTYDCSGLTQMAWLAAGVQIPRVSRDQAQAGTQIPRAQAQPGDLLFWSPTGTVDGVEHVALYLGNGWIREAPRTGTPVRDRALGTERDQRLLLPFVVRPGAASAAP